MKTNDDCFSGGSVAATARVLEKGIDWLSRSEAMGFRVAG
jgi:hypothetical protein